MSETREKPCHECGAPLTFAPGVGQLQCQFCGTVNEIEGAGRGLTPWGLRDRPSPEIRELDYEAALNDALADAEIEETPAIRCTGCGAEVGLDQNTLADTCPFCATPLARDTSRMHRHPRPQGVLPFAFDQRAGKQRLSAWLGSLWFAPTGLTRYAEAGRPLHGVYLPHYTYDAVGDAQYTGMRGDAYFVTRKLTVMVDGKPQVQMVRERKIRWSPRSGRVRHVFDDVLVPASDTMTAGSGSAEYGGASWDLAALEPYRTDFLAGFRAEAPSVSLEDGYQRAQSVMEQMMIREVRFDIGGDEQRIKSMHTRYSSITFKHVLLPVWLATYRYGNKPYRVAINGRTGQVTGERPYSAWKIAVAVLLGLLIAAAVGYAVAMSR